MTLKKLRDDNEGVSEVMGSILTLSITVVIFTSVLYGVYHLESPEEKTFTDLSYEYEIQGNGNGTLDYYVNVTNKGGHVLEIFKTQVYLISEGQSVRKPFSEDGSGNDFDDGSWGLGDTLNLEIEKGDTLYDQFNSTSKRVSLLVMDTEKESVIWRKIVKKPGEFPPIIRSTGVNYRYNWEKSAIPGGKVELWADVIDKDTREVLNVTVNLTTLEGYSGSENRSKPMTLRENHNYRPLKENRYVRSINISEDQSNGSYLLEVNATDGEHDARTQYMVLHVGDSPIEQRADIRVAENKIDFQPTSPNSGDLFTTTATIYNAGDKNATADIIFTDNRPDGSSEVPLRKNDVRFAAGGGKDISATWSINYSGDHDITIEATNVTNGDIETRTVSVNPNILLVDDDKVDNDNSDVKGMENSLSSSGFPYEKTTVKGTHGPSSEKLNKYDIVIWMTGKQSQKTLTSDDRDNLKTFTGNGHKLWLIGEGVVDDAKSGGWESWLENNLYLDGTTQTDNAPQGDLYGNALPLNSTDKFDVDNGDNEGDYLTNDTTTTRSTSMLVDSGHNNETVAVNYDGLNTSSGERTVFQSVRFRSIDEKTSGGRTYLTYKVIMWLGNLSSRSINDLALVNQEFSNRFPNYKDTIDITGNIRNNGRSNQTVEVALEVDGEIENRTNEFIEGDGGSEQVQFGWIADEVGEHKIKIVVDPFDRIQESNNENNDITYQDVNVTVVVRYTTLVVDDAHQGTGAVDETIESYEDLGYSYDRYNVGPSEDGPTVDNMSYYNAVCWITGKDTDNTLREADRENIGWYLSNYSSDFLLIGNGILEDFEDGGISTSERAFLENIMGIDSDRLDAGQHTTELHGVERDPISHGMSYATDYFLDTHTYELNSGQPILKGKDGGNYSHRYKNASGDYDLVYLGVDPTDFDRPTIKERWYDDFEMDVDTSADALREEFVYMTNRWFGKRDDRVELRVSSVDIHLEDKHPMVSNSYGIRVEVQNTGDTGWSTMVRIKDGQSHIGTESLYVGPNDFADLEIKWEPLYAGPDRPIRVLVDPVGEVPEIPNEPGTKTPVQDDLGFNNQAIKRTPVFYFWDDMENGSEKWKHEANLAMINGENPLDYMSSEYDELDTNVAQDWNETKDVDTVDWSSHSDPNSYFMQEPVGKIGRRADVFLGIAIDNSHSMSNREYPEGSGTTWLDHAKNASITLVNSLSNKSVVCVWTFEGQNPGHPVSATQLTGNGRNEVINGIKGIEPKPITSIWDATGEAYMEVNNNIGDYPDLTPAIAALGDGGDIASADDSANLKMLESGSKDWAPWGNMQPGSNYPEQYYPSHLGKYQFPYSAYTPSDDGTWRRADGPQYNPYRKGLLHSDIPLYTIGLGVEHFDNIPNWDETTTNVEPNDGDVTPEDVYKNPSGTNDPKNKEAGTLEYNLWRISNTSDAEYFFAPDPENLTDIFQQIGDLISGPQNLSSIGDGNLPIQVKGSDSKDVKSDGNDVKLQDEGFPNAEGTNSDKWAVTPTLNLQNMSSAWLNFWQRYRLIQGVNGAYLEVGYHNDTNNEWMWKYVKPSIGPYRGNLLLGNLPTDDYGNEIQWCWNGKSDGGTMDWEFVKMDIMNHLGHVPPEERDQVRIKFMYDQFGGATVPGGWLIDDVNVVASRRGDNASNIHSGMDDVWQRTDNASHSGDHSWWNGEPGEARFRGGLDNRLVTTPIDLTHAKTAELSAYFKFNINSTSGLPPDGFRVELSNDQGISWDSINVGVRTASGVSGDASSNYWVSAGDLSRLQVDLSDYSGETVQMRFRVVTNTEDDHYQDDSLSWGGFYVDDVVVSGKTIQG